MLQISDCPFNIGIHRNPYFISISLILIIGLLQPNTVYCQSLSSEQIYQKVGGAVVTINAYSDDGKSTAQSSGVVLNDSGWVITNYQLLYGNSRIKIMNGKEPVPYTDIIVVDPAKDLLIFKIKAKKFPRLIIGNPTSLAAGAKVYAVASPLSKDSLVSEGVITQFIKNDKLKRSYIQITAGISMKSRGGAVVNDKGELIGISTTVVSNEKKVNFAIPVNEIINVVVGSYGKNDRFKDFKYFASGLHAIENRNYSSSIAELSEYILRIPNDPVAYNCLGSSLNETMNYSDAVQKFDKAIEISPDYADAFFGRGVARQNLKNYDGAFSDYTKAIALNANDTLSLIKRSQVLFKLHKYHEAIQDLDKALMIAPGNAEAYYYRAMSKDSLWKIEEALSDLKSAANYDTSYRRLYLVAAKASGKKYLLYGSRLFVEQNYLPALQCFEKAIDFDHSAEAYFRHGLCKMKLRDNENALKDFDQAILLCDWDGVYFRMRGILKYNMQDHNGATVDWMKASRLGDKESRDLMMKFR
ncbi:MAG: tetratricopeptide repeat protein [Ignavibacteria bacterium]|nr:tetratricopeptide repeat protein [Ignavibacteria bacterium]